MAPILTLGPVARASNGVIGAFGGLPWRLKSDMIHFRALTLGKPVIMGRKTWESLPRRPLAGRTNIVLSRDSCFEAPGAMVCEDFAQAARLALEQAVQDGAEEVCVIGGSAVFAAALPRARRIYLTEVEASPLGEVVFPRFDERNWIEVRRDDHPASPEDDHCFVFRVLERRPQRMEPTQRPPVTKARHGGP